MNSAVDSPTHYRRGGHELADVIDAFDLGRWEAQAAQYLFRARFKDNGTHEPQDIAKAIAFLIRALIAMSPATLETFRAFGFRLVKDAAAEPADADAAGARLLRAHADLAEQKVRRRVPRTPGALERVLLAEALAVYGSTVGGQLLSALTAMRERMGAGEPDGAAPVIEALEPLLRDDPFTRFVVELAEWAADRRVRGEPFATPPSAGEPRP